MTKDEFFTALKLAKIAKAEGTFDKGTNTITARRCKLDDRGGSGGGGGGNGEAEGKGEVSALDLGAGTFEVSLTEWEGFSSKVGTKIKVTTSDKTVYRGKNGDTVDKASFFAQIEQYGNAEVKGTYAKGTIVATRCKVED